MADDALGTMRVNQLNEEVLFAIGGSVDVGQRDIEELKERASDNQRKRIRLCAHQDIEDKVHEMLIVHTRDTYVRPHKHLTKCESLHVIEGAFDLVMFGEQGNITEIVPMGDYWSGKAFFHRSMEPQYHTLLISSDYLVFHETANGPFNRFDTILADWAPDQSEGPAGREYMERLGEAVKSFLRR